MFSRILLEPSEPDSHVASSGQQANIAKSAMGSNEIISFLPFAREIILVPDAGLARIVKHNRCPPRTVASELAS
jgi:hypothetical protein